MIGMRTHLMEQVDFMKQIVGVLLVVCAIAVGCRSNQEPDDLVRASFHAVRGTVTSATGAPVTGVEILAFAVEPRVDAGFQRGDCRGSNETEARDSVRTGTFSMLITASPVEKNLCIALEVRRGNNVIATKTISSAFFRFGKQAIDTTTVTIQSSE